jgi:hypothetical protein
MREQTLRGLHGRVCPGDIARAAGRDAEGRGETVFGAEVNEPFRAIVETSDGGVDRHGQVLGSHVLVG